MLNSLEVEEELLHLGFQLSKASVHAREFIHPAMSQPVYLKTKADGKETIRQAVRLNPLVLHHEFSSELDAALSHGLIESKTLVHNTSFSQFPKRLNDGTVPISFGYAVGVESAQQLRQLFEQLAGEPFVEAEADRLRRRAVEADIDAGLAGRVVSVTTRAALIEARVGQGKYRQEMLRIWGRRCAVSGCSIEAVLIASHAVAWSDNKDPDVCLDPYNGLLLAASIDRLFDRGLISFDAEGRMLRKPKVTNAELRRLGLPPEARLRSLPPKSRAYLAEHRKRFGF